MRITETQLVEALQVLADFVMIDSKSAVEKATVLTKAFERLSEADRCELGEYLAGLAEHADEL